MLAYVLSAMGDDLTAVIGAHVPQVSSYNSMQRGQFYFADTVIYLFPLLAVGLCLIL